MILTGLTKDFLIYSHTPNTLAYEENGGVTFSFRNEFHSFRTILDRVLGTCAAGVHYRLISVWTLVPVRLGKQLSDHSTVDEMASEAADCRHTYTMANCPQSRLEKPGEEKEGRRTRKEKSSKRGGLVVLGSGEENPRVFCSVMLTRNPKRE
ncbi:hypothetical protein TNCV_1015691 [Trichonephila clavipes]|uniref:Uncharacterized protein n=1 Tax=Trichonephila clavipes TaxID=2585209 RepID=A0A8X6VXY9_TRICX|nr:hypothetical protein TNCV_1015691 [Trichonephila clavipes]